MNSFLKKYLTSLPKPRAVPAPGYTVDKANPKVLEILRQAELSGDRVRIFYGDPFTGKDNLTEDGVSGTVTHVDGIPVLYPTANSAKAVDLPAENIVRLLVNGREVYRHPGYKLPVIRIALGTEGMWAAYVNYAQEPHKLFPSERRAVAWKAFMHGDRLTK